MQKNLAAIDKKFGVSGAQIALLHEIAKTPNIGISQLAKNLFISQSTCSLLISKLIKKKLVSKIRSTSDERKIQLKLSNDAIMILTNTPNPKYGTLPLALKNLNSKELKNLELLLNNIVKQLEK